MDTKGNKVVGWFYSGIIFLVTTGFTLLAIELLLFGYILTLLPTRAHWTLDEEVRVLAQSSKGGLIPKDYIALVGDSYAEGMGDWYFEVQHEHRPAFHSAHVLRELTGTDVISFGSSGSGSVRSYVAEPIMRYRALNSVNRFQVNEPKQVVAFFYEGNDLDNNIHDLKLRYESTSDIDLLFDTKYFDESYLAGVVQETDELARKVNDPKFFDKLYLSRLVLRSVRDRFVSFKAEKNNGKSLEKGQIHKQTTTNRVLLDDVIEFIPANLQSPSLELDQKQIAKSLYVVERSLNRLLEEFKQSEILLVFIPSVLSSYSLQGSPVSIATYHGEIDTFPASMVYERSDYIEVQIKEIARRIGIDYVDARPELRAVANKNFIHGPSDWQHLNELGYTVLAKIVASKLGS